MSKNYTDKFLKLQMPDYNGFSLGGAWEESQHWNSLCEDLAELWQLKDNWKPMPKFRQNIPKIYALLKEMESDMDGVYSVLHKRDFPEQYETDEAEA